MYSLEEIKNQSLDNEVPIIFDDTAKVLTQTIKDVLPTNILEIGGGMGFSGKVMLAASDGHTKLTSIEKDPERYPYLKKHIHPHTALHGDAYEVMQDLISQGQQFDFVFLDGPKGQYAKYFDLIEQLLKEGGTVFADNMNFHGMVDGSIPTTKGARTIVNGLKNYVSKIMHKGYPMKNLDDGDGIIIYTKTNETND